MHFEVKRDLFLRCFLIWAMTWASAYGASVDVKVREDSTDRATNERYIPVELWSGAARDGKRELKMPKVDAIYVHQSRYQIRGPVEWKHPVTGQMFLVYERINPGKSGTKLQLLAINEEKSGLGRLYDARPGLGTRMFSGGLKFPVGNWKEGETRKFSYRAFADSKEPYRVEQITIKRIDFTLQEMPHCLEFYWTDTDREEKRFYDRQTYVYCPGKSMVVEIQH